MELRESVLETGHGHTHWNPGITQVTLAQQQQAQQGQGPHPDPWPPMSSGPECLMNVDVNPAVGEGDVTSMFGGGGGYPLVLSSEDGGGGGNHRLSEFRRHPFPSITNHSGPSMHFSNIPSSCSSSGGIGGHHGHEGLTLINIPTLTHSTLRGGNQQQDGEGNPSVQGQVQDDSLGLELEGGGGGRHHGLDDCSEDCTEDEEDEDEIEDSDDEEMGYIHHNHNHAMTHQSMNVEQDHPLPSCQHPHQQHQLRVMNSNGGDVMGNAINMENHPKNSILSQIHDIEEEIPPISQGHPLNSNPISAIPMITGNCNMMMDHQQQQAGNTSQQPGDPSLLGINNGDPSSCSSSGHSVHGKMYVEERVVFHLKQWTESGFGNFNSCREQDMNLQKNQYGCAVCNIRSLHNNLANKETHRHLVRGILFSFEDCIILELHPEEYMGGEQEEPEPRSHHPLSMSMDPKHITHMGNTADKADEETVPLSYFNSSSTSAMPEIVLPDHGPLSSLEKQSSSLGHNQHNNQEGGWWEYESTEREDVDGIEERQHISHHVSSESCAINLKLTAQHFHDAQAAVAARETNEMGEINAEVQEMENINDINNESAHNYQDSLPYYSNAESINDNHQVPTVTIPSKCIVEDDENDNNVDENEPSPISDGQLPVQIQNQDVADAFPQTAEDTLENERCLELEIPSLPPESDHDDDTSAQPLPPPIYQNGNNIVSDKLKKSTPSRNKYPCPRCEKQFRVKRHLSDHLKQGHSKNDGKTSGKSRKNILKPNLSIELVQRGLEIERNEQNEVMMKVEEVPITNQCLSNPHSTTESSISNPGDGGESEILELVLASKSSKVRKFSEKAIRKLEKQAALAVSISPLDREFATKPDNPPKTSLEMKIGDEENRTEENESRVDGHLKTSTNKLNTTSPIKINHDQNHLHFIEPTTSDKDEIKSIKSKEFHCEVCGQTFSQHRRLINHAACHKPEKSSQCEQCGKSFARRDKLLRHMFVHNEQKMFSCHICEKRFSRRDKLSDHLKSHQTDEIHNCNVCERQFLRPDILKQHLKMHLMEDKHQCSECLRFVTGKARLDQHMKRHEEAKASGMTLLCPLCTKYFIQAQSLKAHIRKFHPDALSQLNLNQLQFGASSSDDGGNNLMDNPRCTESPPTSSSNSNNSSSSTELGPATVEQDVEKIIPPEKSTTTVCQVLETVMNTSSKCKSRTKPRKVLRKPVVVKKDSTGEINSKSTFSCVHCSKTFSRNQTLKNHEIRKHSSVPERNLGESKSLTTATTVPIIVTSDEPQIDTSDQNKGKSRKNIVEERSYPELPSKKLHPKKKHNSTKTKVDSRGKEKRKIAGSSSGKPSSQTTRECPPNLPGQTLSLPSCATLTQDLGFNLNASNNSTFQSNPYSHHLARLVVGEGLQTPLPLGSLVVTGLPHQGGQQLSSIQLVNAQGQQIEIGQSICPQTSSFVISYPNPTTATMSFQP